MWKDIWKKRTCINGEDTRDSNVATKEMGKGKIKGLTDSNQWLSQKH